MDDIYGIIETWNLDLNAQKPVISNFEFDTTDATHYA